MRSVNARQCQIAFACTGNDRGGNRMTGLPLKCGGLAQDVPFVIAISPDFDIRDLRSASREGTGFVQADRPELAKGFQHAAALDQQSPTGRAGKTGGDGRRRGDDKGTGQATNNSASAR